MAAFPVPAAILAILVGFGPALPAQKAPQELSVYARRVRPREPPTGLDWDARITALLKEEPGDVIVTAVGDLIFNQPISQLVEPERRGLLRILQEADVAYGNLECSINDRPDAQRPFYNFRAPKEFVWELARTGFNLVSMANNHALDFGPEGLKECLRNLDHAQIEHAGAGNTLAEAHALAVREVQGQPTRFGLLSYLRYWTMKYRAQDPGAAALATIDPAVILVARDGKVEAVEGPLESDVKAMEEDLLLARRKADVLMVALHNHDVSHHRRFGIQSTTPANDMIMFHRAVEAGADLVLGSGPHVLRGIELYKGRPIFYSLANFIYQYRTPDKIPADLIHQRDLELARPANLSVWDRRDSPETMEGVVARMTLNQGRLRRIQLIPFVIDDEGPLYGVPRLVGDARAKAILEGLRRLSAPFGTRLEDKGWYAEVALAEAQ